MKYSNVLKAVANADNSQWNIGDALIKDCGTPGNDPTNDGSFARIDEARIELEANGFEYAFDTLRHMRDTAYSFEPVLRSTGYSICKAARDPVTLNAFLASIGTTRATKALIELYRKHQLERWQTAITELQAAKIPITAASMSERLKVDPLDAQAAMYSIGALRLFVAKVEQYTANAIKRGASTQELEEIGQLGPRAIAWLEQLKGVMTNG